jgi:C1A family cysteine protease
MLKSFLSSAFLISLAFADHSFDHEFSSRELANENIHGLFQSWRFKFGKVYESVEEEMERFAIFKFNLERIAQSNDQFLAGELTYRVKMNQFGDLTDNEFKAMYNCAVLPKTVETNDDAILLGGDDADKRATGDRDLMPEGATVDWNAQGKVTPVKNQGQCGSCWAFSATGSLECNYAIKHNNSPRSLSEQQLVDCSGAYGNQGCNGGWYYDAWKYVEKEGGLCTESEYPYKGVDGTCKASSCGSKYNDPSGYKAITADSESSLQSAVNNGCVSVAIQANQFAFQYYSGGVLTGTCGTRIDHAVLAVGYGTMNGQDYWYVKNSWGETWGEKGYVYICKDCGDNGNKGECGINMYPYQVDF